MSEMQVEKPGRIEINAKYRDGRSYYYGAIWPLGYEAAVNAAQAREFEHAIQSASVAA